MNNRIEENLKISSVSYAIKIKTLTICAAICLTCNMLNISALYYLGLFGILALSGLQFVNVLINKWCLSFFFICLSSIIFNEIPAQYNPYSKIVLYFLILSLFGPLFINKELLIYRCRLLSILMNMCIFIVLFSFFLMLFGIIPQINPNERSGGFSGLTSSSMTMAPLAVLSILFCIYRFLQYRKKKFLILLGISLYVLLITGARSAMGAFLFSVVVFFWIYYRSNLSRFFLYLFITLIALSVSFPLWSSSLSVFAKKMAVEEAMDGDNSRTNKWENRLTEFYLNPVLGVGFFSLDSKVSDSDIIEESGNLEYGSSWLGVLSTTGICGFICFLFFFVRYSYVLYFSKCEVLLKSFFLSLLSFFGLHMIFEGYLISVGNFLNILFWLSFSIIVSFSYSRYRNFIYL